MKVVQVEYRGHMRNVFLYDGMSSSEVSALLSACVASAHASSGAGSPRILALREPDSGRVVPLSLALKHLPSLWPRFQLICDEQPPSSSSGGGASTARGIPAVQRAVPAAVTVRPSSSPVFSSSSVGGLPTPIPRHTYEIAPSPESARPIREERPLRVNNYTHPTARATNAPAAKYNFTGGAYDSSPQDSASSSPRFSAESPRSSVGSWVGERGSGVHAVLSYPELLDILTGHVPANVNNGPRPGALDQPHYMLALAIVLPGDEASEDLFVEFQRFASSAAFPNLIFLIIEAPLLRGTTLEVEQSALPSFQFFLRGHLLGQLSSPTTAQLASILHSSNRLVGDNPDLRIEDGEEVDDDEDSQEDEEDDEDEDSEFESSVEGPDEAAWRRATQRAAQAQQDAKALADGRARVAAQARAQQVSRGTPAQSRAQSLGAALDGSYALSAAERREVFQNAADEEARWAQLLQASPKQGPSSRRWRPSPGASPDPSDSEARESPQPSDSEGEFELEPQQRGLVIRGTKIPIHTTAPTMTRAQAQAQSRGQAPPQAQRGQLQDWNAYETFDGADSIDESFDGSEPYSPSDSAPEESDEEREAALAGHKRKTHPIGSDDEEGAVADGGSEAGYDYSQALALSPRTNNESVSSSALASLTSSPLLAPRPNGVVMSASESREIERLIMRTDPDVRAAFRACPGLDTMMEVFVRMVSFQLAHPLGSQPQPMALSAPVDSPGKKRKSHPVQTLVSDEPRHKRLLAESARLARAAAVEANARHKRASEQVYAANSSDEYDDSEPEPTDSQPSDSEAFISDSEKIAPETLLAQREQTARSNLQSQQAKYAELEAQYLQIQNEIFSRTVQDLLSASHITRAEHGYLVHLWTSTESGSDSIRALIKDYETGGDEALFMVALVKMARRFGAGLGVGAEESPAQSEGSEGSQEDEDDEEEEADESPLNSDEDRQYRAILSQFERDNGSEQDAAEESYDESPEPSESEASPYRGPRSSTKAPRPSPTSGAPPSNQFEARAREVADEAERAETPESAEEAALATNLALVRDLVEANILSAADGHRAQQYLVHNHPLLQAAFLAFAYSSDLEDLVDTITMILAQSTGSKPNTPAKPAPAAASGAAPKAAAPVPALTGLPSASLRESPALLQIMPPWIVEQHRPALEALVAQQDPTLLRAWDVLQQAIHVRGATAAALAVDVEKFIETVTQRLEQGGDDDEEESEQEPSDSQKEDEEESPSAGAKALSVEASIADALQVTSVLHAGRVFDDEETAVLWALILQQNPVITAAFDVARENSEYDELHDTLIRLIAHHASMKSSLHPLLPMVRKATGVMTSADVANLRDIMSRSSPAQRDGTPSKQQALPAPGTPLSPSIPQSNWSRSVKAFTSAIEYLQSTGSLSDASALALIDAFQARSPDIIEALERLEEDQNEDEFRYALIDYAEEMEERKQQQQASEEQHSQASQAQSAREKLLQSFAERVQQVQDAEEAGENDEDEDQEEEDQEDEDGADSDASLAALLAKDDGAEWDESSINALYAKVQQMQTELAALKMSRAQAGHVDEESDEEDWSAVGEEDDESQEEEEEEEKDAQDE